MSDALGFAALSADQPLAPFAFQRREPVPHDVRIQILYCGVCHSDLHTARNEWRNTRYPSMPGHEIVGKVIAVGSEVKSFKAGDVAGVGCLVDSCRECASCKEGEEQFCEVGFTGTYNGSFRGGGENTLGGYSNHIMVDEKFVLRISHTGQLAAVAPLLCAGITTYSPLVHWKVGPGQKVGVVGLGGLGHMAVKLAAAMGAEVTVLSTSDRKRADAERMGARHFLINSDKAAMKAAGEKFDLIINTVSATHEIASHLNLLARDGTMVMLGLTTEGLPVFALPLLWRRRSVAGSLIGGIRETQEMLDFCAQHGIVCDIETIAPHQINEAYARMEKSDVRYRFVIDMAQIDQAA